MIFVSMYLYVLARLALRWDGFIQVLDLADELVMHMGEHCLERVSSLFQDSQAAEIPEMRQVMMVRPVALVDVAPANPDQA